MSSSYKKFKQRSASAAAALAFGIGALSAGLAQAELIFNSGIEVTGTGLGAVNTIVTGNDTGNGNGTESACVSFNGTTDTFDCHSALQGGDNLAINQTFLVSEITDATAGDVAVVLNIAETGQDLTVTLTDLYLSFYSPTGLLLHVANYEGPDLELTQGTGTGLGGSGFVRGTRDPNSRRRKQLQQGAQI